MDLGLFQKSLKDLESCLDEFESLTGIDMVSAKALYAQSLLALERKDLSSLYELVQELYRDGFLGALIEISK